MYTAISRKVVGKSARDDLERYCGWFEFTILQRNLREWHERPWIYVCKCYRKVTKVGSKATVSGTVNWSYPILPFGIVACTFFPTIFLEIAVCVFSIESLSHGYDHFYHRFPKLQSTTLKLGKILYWTVCWRCKLVILENLNNDERQKRISLFFLLSFPCDL